MPTDLKFHERMEGFFAAGQNDPLTGDQTGQNANPQTRFAFEVTIHTTDLDRFISDPNHTATVTGFYEGNFAPLGAPFVSGQVFIDKGIFNFMSPGAGKQRYMEHHHVFAIGQKRYRLDGYKFLEHHPLTWDEWGQLTTLFTTIAELPAGSTFDPTQIPVEQLRVVDPKTVVASGVTHFAAKDTFKLIRSFEVTGTSDPFGAKMRFLELFLGDEAEVLLADLRGFDTKGRRRVLSKPASERQSKYDVVIIGSGYGGGVAAARLSASPKNKSIAVLERGKEYRAGDFPDQPSDLPDAMRTDDNPLGLFEFHFDPNIDALVGNGLGGTSLINANTMLRPDAGVTTTAPWPTKLPNLDKYYDRAEKMLAPQKHPSPPLKSVRFRQSADATVQAPTTDLVPIAVTFAPTHRADANVDQSACTGCGGCVTGCNFGAKNTVDMNYLAVAELQGANIFTRIEVTTIEPKVGGWIVHTHDHSTGKDADIEATEVVLAAGTYGTFKVLARSRAAHALQLSDRLGEGFSGNGDVLGFGYNTPDRTQITEGPTITSVARFNQSDPDPRARFIIEEGGIPQAIVPIVRSALPLARTFEGASERSGFWDGVKSWLRVEGDQFGFDTAGAMNHTQMFFAMGFEEKLGKLVLKSNGKVSVSWDDPENENFAKRADDEMLSITNAAKGVYLDNPLSRQFLGHALITAHPIGGCAMGQDATTGVVDAKGAVFGQTGLYVADGSILSTPLGANPALTISALAEWISEQIVAGW